MSEIQTQPVIPSRETSQSHEPLTDEQLGNLLAALGNHEGKATLLMAMQPEAMYTQGSLYHLLTERIQGEPVYKGRDTNAMGWCKRSLEPIGLVARVEEGAPTRYGITQLGIEIGKPLAGLLLNFSDKHNISLSTIWGETQSRSEIRSPYARVKVIKQLLHATAPVTPSVISKGTGLGAVHVEFQLSTMDRDSLVTYESWDKGAQDITYIWQDYASLLNPRGGRGKEFNDKTIAALEYLKEYGRATLDELTDFGWDCLNDREKQLITREALRFSINDSMKRLHNKGAIDRETKMRPDTVYLTEAQRAFWKELFEGLNSIQARDEQALADYVETGQHYLDNPAGVGRGIQRSYESTSKGAAAVGKDLGSLVLNILQGNDTLSVRDITETISRTERSVSVFGVRTVLKRLVEQGALLEIDDKVKRYRQKPVLHS